MNHSRLLPAPAAALLLLLAAGLPAQVQAQAGRRVFTDSPLPPSSPMPALSSGSAPAPPSTTSPALSTNYRLTLTAKSGKKPLGVLSLLTCAPALDASGFLDKPEDDTLPATTLTLRGTLSEQEGGKLLLAYTLGLSTPVATQTVVSFAAVPAKGAEAGDKAGDAKAAAEEKERDEKAAADAKAGLAKNIGHAEPDTTRNKISTAFAFRNHFSTGALRVQPGRTYELVTMAGVAYTLTLSPEPLR